MGTGAEASGAVELAAVCDGAAAEVEAEPPKLKPAKGLAGFDASAAAGFADDDDEIAGGAMLP